MKNMDKIAEHLGNLVVAAEPTMIDSVDSVMSYTPEVRISGGSAQKLRDAWYAAADRVIGDIAVAKAKEAAAAGNPAMTIKCLNLAAFGKWPHDKHKECPLFVAYVPLPVYEAVLEAIRPEIDAEAERLTAAAKYNLDKYLQAIAQGVAVAPQ